jgi:hypothetical protein
MDTQDIVSDENLGYRPILEVKNNTVPNPCNQEGIAQQMDNMDDTPRYEDANMDRHYSYSEADVGDNGTQRLDDPHSVTGAM